MIDLYLDRGQIPSRNGIDAGVGRLLGDLEIRQN